MVKSGGWKKGMTVELIVTKGRVVPLSNEAVQF